MRYVAGLFDAPAPAAAGMSVLAAAGIGEPDVHVLSNADDADSPQRTSDTAAFLRAHGVPADTAFAFAEAVAGGGILLFARVPSARAGQAASALRAVGALDLGGGRALSGDAAPR